MFDQSQSFGPLKFERDILTRLGVSHQCTHALEQLTKALYVAYPRTGQGFFRVDRTQRPIRDTGGTDTSLGNSINMAYAWMHVLIQQSEYVEEFGKLGFKMKIRTHENIEKATFLKGMWYRCSHGVLDYFWGPLPSRFLKMGKSLKDPRTLAHYQLVLKRENCLPDQRLKRAAELFMNDIAHSYNTFAPIPLVRRFCAQYAKSEQIKNLLEDHQVKPTGNSVVLLDPEGQLSSHYDVPLEWWSQVEALIPDRPFVFIQHPLLKTLLKDYN
jgi:hypothetical protein